MTAEQRMTKENEKEALYLMYPHHLNQRIVRAESIIKIKLHANPL